MELWSTDNISAIQSITRSFVKYKRNRPLVIKLTKEKLFQQMEDGNPHDVDAACRVNRWPSADSRTGRFLCVKSEFVIPIYKKSAGICTCYSSRPTRPFALPNPVWTSNAEAHADMYNTTYMPYTTIKCTGTPMAIRQLRSVYNTPRGIYVALFLTGFLKVAKFQIVKTKA